MKATTNPSGVGAARFWGIRGLSIVVAFVACYLTQEFSTHQSLFFQRLVFLAGLYVTLSVSLNLINGITGQSSIGHAAFYQVGAYATGFVAQKFYSSAHLPPTLWLVLVMVVGAIAASIAGLVVGLPSLRLRGDYLAIVTLGFGEIIRIVAQNQPSLGGAYGMPVEPRLQFIWMSWMLAIVCIAVCRNLLKTAHGLPFLAVREDEVASGAMGVNVTMVKVVAFLLGSAFAGAAGALYAHSQGFISPAMFTMDVSFVIVTMVVLGGTGSITGSVVAAVLLFYLPEKMRDLSDVRMSMIVGSLIALVLGIAAFRELARRYHGPQPRRVLYGFGIVLGIVIVALIFRSTLVFIPGLGGTVEGSKLRMVVFAVTLITLMLLRPMGIFGHHEFSWSWVKRLFGKPAPSTEVAA